MRLPRDVSGDELVKKLRQFDYAPTRQTGSHIRLTRQVGEETHHVTIPRHSSLRVGTLNQILSDVAFHLGIDKQQLLQDLFS
jgi:predicted RNA binding protein YcfA (HicA-like mRNA interferase family)